MPKVQTSALDSIVANPPAHLFTRAGLMILQIVFTYLLIGTLHLDGVLSLIKEYHLLGA
tara:strand:- start:294 stop:470 length:177 start_codon:yes stop_codon:yes gene_type:complete